MKTKQPDTSLFAILARKAAVGVIFRRGPSKQVQLIKWDREKDTFEEGQWLKARVYERRCDLSPNGTLLIYFAATYKAPMRSWTAISKPPWFTALALWPKGDGWNGGGVFNGPYAIRLNHPAEQATPHEDFVAGCRKFQIDGYAVAGGEDATVWNETLVRDGWEFIQEAEWGDYEEVKGYAWKAKSPTLWRKKSSNNKLVLEMAIQAIGKRNNRWYISAFRVLDSKLQEIANLGELDWADWDEKRGLVFAKEGALYRQQFTTCKVGEPKQLANFSSNKFSALEAPEWVKKL